MSEKHLKISDADLQAYVDQQLDAAQRAQVEAYLELDPDAAERVRAYEKQNEMLHQAFDSVLLEPVPARMQQVAKPEKRSRVIVLAASLAVGVIGGWLLRGELSPNPPVVLLSLPSQAAVAHAVYSQEVLHPVEVRAEQQEHLVKWLSKRLKADVHAPNLVPTGYALEGGRLLPGEQGPAAQFMYRDNNGQRLTLYLRTDIKSNTDTAFRYSLVGDVGVFYWVDRDIAYALSGEMDRTRLLAVAEAVYHDLNP